MVRAAPTSVCADRRDDAPPAAWTTAYPRWSVASGDSARARARWWAMSSPARASAWVEDAAARGRAGRRPRRPARRAGCAGRRGRGAPAGRPAPATRGRRAGAPATGPARGAQSRRWSSSAMSGTSSLAASVGVEARTSATRSSSGVSGSWPIADTTGVRVPATARTRASSLNGSRSSTEPPPRATTITSTCGVAVEPRRARRSPRWRRGCPASRRTPSRRPRRASGGGRSRRRRARRRSPGR